MFWRSSPQIQTTNNQRSVFSFKIPQGTSRAGFFYTLLLKYEVALFKLGYNTDLSDYDSNYNLDENILLMENLRLI